MAALPWCVAPGIVTPILEPDPNRRQLGLRQSFEAGNIDGDQRPQIRNLDGAERLDAANAAEAVADPVAAELVFAKQRLSTQQPEVAGWHHCLPEPLLAADRAVASLCSGGEVCLALEYHCAAVAAPPMSAAAGVPNRVSCGCHRRRRRSGFP